MLTRRLVSTILLMIAALTLIVAVPGSAEAQRRRLGPRLIVRPPVIVTYGYPRWYYDPWYQWGPYGYPYPPYGYGYGYRDQLTTSVRLEVDQRDAEVFVDGYRAGIVDDFDGVFQRLRLTPGGHRITVYLDGYRTVHENVYLSSGTDRKIRLTMERLPEGERSEAPPDPADRAGQDDPQEPDPRVAPRRPGRAPAGPSTPAGEAPRRFGTLSILVQPADAEIYVDGERWNAPSGSSRISIDLAEGRHRIELRKAGFATYSEEVLIRRGATLTLNVSLTGGA